MNDDVKRLSVEQYAELTERQQKIYELWHSGWTYPKMSKELGLSLYLIHTEINRILDHLEHEWKQRPELHLFRELDRLNHIEYEAMRAWERSQQVQITTVDKKEDDVRGVKSTEEIRKSKPVGDGQFLRIVGWCVSKRCELLKLGGIVLQLPEEAVEQGEALAPVDLGALVKKMEGDRKAYEKWKRQRLAETPVTEKN